MAVRDDRRRVLGLIGSGLTVGFAGCSAFSKNGASSENSGGRNGAQTTTETIQDPTSSTTKTETKTETETTSEVEPVDPEDLEPAPKAYQAVSRPEKADEYKYATMGSEDASVTARFYGAWKCPYTRHFVLDILPTLIEKYVKPGDVAIEFRAVAYEDGEGFHGPDSPRAARAGLVVWNQDPDQFWTYFGTVFKNQNSAPGWATTEMLLNLAEKADVSDRSDIASLIESGKYQSQIEKTMDQVHDIPITRVPRIVVDDTVTAPTVSPKKTKAQLDAALGKGSKITTTKDDSETTTTKGDGSGTTTTKGNSGTTTDTTTGTTKTSGDSTTTTTGTTTTTNSTSTTTGTKSGN
ncbi:DsbA family protein [Haladaptatus sp.]|uniref:DsbA family protein n=1 Tax=Haladaptatus sp. TaxID=1973141 RepID=UPI003C3C7AF2